MLLDREGLQERMSTKRNERFPRYGHGRFESVAELLSLEVPPVARQRQ